MALQIKEIQQAQFSEPLDVARFTECKLDGDGVLDKLLETLRIQLDKEYTSKRIVGPDYANAFVQL